MKHINLLAIIFLLILSACTNGTMTGIEDSDILTAQIDATELQMSPKIVPIKGSFSGSGIIDLSRDDCPAGTLPIIGEGIGTASHAGKIQVKFSHCSYFLVDSQNPTYVDGFGEMISANGDTIRSTYFGNLTGPDTFIDYNTITGGSGRFEGATGEFIEYGKAVFTNSGFDYEISFEGEISSVGSFKRMK